jgi:hypothetical protein
MNFTISEAASNQPPKHRLAREKIKTPISD